LPSKLVLSQKKMLLSIETSTRSCSVAVHRNKELLACTEIQLDHSHSSVLTVLIEQTLKQLNADFSDLEAVAVSAGPGSYTGLRIGVSVAKGLCYALGIPLWAVDTLQAMAAEVRAYTFDQEIRFCPMLDARRMEVYTALYDAQLQKIKPVQAMILDSESFAQDLLEAPVVFLGDGSNKFRTIVDSKNAHFVSGVVPSAKHVGFLASENPVQVDTAYFEPLYLKEFVAKLKGGLLAQ
jgi:tRNA threonylcarbamoyladenosine biosynthesis protein TsaB